MKAIILAAGQGTRIRTAHGNHPKCLICCNSNGWTILDQQIDGLFAAGVKDIGLVVGYEKDQIMQHVARHYRRRLMHIDFIENARFAETNNIYSLWLARDWLRGDRFTCLNADVVCDARILADAVHARELITMMVDRAWRDETMKVVIDDDRVIRMSKKISRAEYSATYIGITNFSSLIHASLFQKIGALIDSGEKQVFFNVAVQELADEGVPVAYRETGTRAWAEIDDPGDLAFARANVFPLLFGGRHAA
jgi:choline kinase